MPKVVQGLQNQSFGPRVGRSRIGVYGPNACCVLQNRRVGLGWKVSHTGRCRPNVSQGSQNRTVGFRFSITFQDYV